MHYSLDIEEPNQGNIAELISTHIEKKWDEKKGGAWWIEDFMAANNLWFTDLQKDLKKVLAGIPAKKLGELDEVRKYTLAYFKPKLLKPGAKPKNTPAVKPKVQETKKAPIVYDYEQCQKIAEGAGTKNEAMSRLRKAGFQNKDIANFMGLKPGRVASGIRAYDMKEDKESEVKEIPKPTGKVQVESW